MQAGGSELDEHFKRSVILLGDIKKYFTDEIIERIAGLKARGLHKAAMQGVLKDLESLIPIIDQLFDDKIFYLNYWKSDAPFFGWSKGEAWDNMAEITGLIRSKFLDIYALLLVGAGKDIRD